VYQAFIYAYTYVHIRFSYLCKDRIEIDLDSITESRTFTDEIYNINTLYDIDINNLHLM
jgi:hypothetical protein